MARKFDEFAEMMLGKCTKLQDGGKHEEALACMAELTKKMPELEMGWHYHGMSLMSLKRYDEAVKSFDKAVSLDPKDWTSISARGLCKFMLKDVDGAKKDFDSSLTINPRDIPTLLFAAVCGAVKGEKVPAEAYIKKAMEVDAETAGELYSSLILSFLEQNMPEPEKKKLREAGAKLGISLEKLKSAKERLEKTKKKK